MLADNGIVHLELEDIPYWWDDGPRRQESDRIRHGLLEAAEALGARHIKVTPDGDDGPWDRGLWAAKFAELATQAHDVGARLGIEFFPWSNIKTLHDGLRLVDDAGHEAGGVIIDAWHIARAHTPMADLASVPLHRIIGVELDDADEQVVGTLFEDTVHRRRYCGEGAFDLVGHDQRPCAPPGGTDRGGSRSCPTSTDPSRSKRRSAGPPPVPAACWTAPGRTPTPSGTRTMSACQRHPAGARSDGRAPLGGGPRRARHRRQILEEAGRTGTAVAAVPESADDGPVHDGEACLTSCRWTGTPHQHTAATP